MGTVHHLGFDHLLSDNNKTAQVVVDYWNTRGRSTRGKLRWQENEEKKENDGRKKRWTALPVELCG